MTDKKTLADRLAESVREFIKTNLNSKSAFDAMTDALKNYETNKKVKR